MPHAACRAVPAAALALLVLAGCSNGLSSIDQRVDTLLAEANDSLGPHAVSPEPDFPPPLAGPDVEAVSPTAARPPTLDPPAEALRFESDVVGALLEQEDREIIARLEAFDVVPPDARVMDLQAALRYAVEHSREYRFAQEDFILATLGLIIQRHLWGPRFFSTISAEAFGEAEDGVYDTALDVIADFTVSQRLPYGGEIAATAVARATEDLHRRVIGEEVQSAELLLTADIPLLRGAGLVAREDLIQANRNAIYAARDFERFRRAFLFDIARDYLDLVVQLQTIEVTVEQVRQLEELEDRAQALVEAGRQRPFQANLAQQDTLFARDRLAALRETFRLSLDRFKVRLGMPSEAPLVIADEILALPVPQVDIERAVETALALRLDLQTQRDLVGDAVRGVGNALNNVLPDLDLNASVLIPTDPDDGPREGLGIDPDELAFSVGLTLGLPLDRTIERTQVREAQIDLQRTQRDYQEFRDAVAVDVRAAVRDIDRALFSLRIQEENVAIAELRRASILAAPERASVRDEVDAVEALNRAQVERARAFRDLQVAILQYLLDSGQLRVEPDGTLMPLPGMEPPTDPVTAAPSPAETAGAPG